MYDFRVYFRDGNQRLYQAENIVDVVLYVVERGDYSADDIIKVEEV